MKHVRTLLVAASSAVILLAGSTAQAQETLTLPALQAHPSAAAGPQPVLPQVSEKDIKLNAPPCGDTYLDPPTSLTDRKSWCAPKNKRGETIPVLEADVIKYCSGKDGCQVRLGMYNWDDTGRVASRHFLFFYNRETRTWRSDLADQQGTNVNNVTEHVGQAWACYFTDGKYANWADQGDTSPDFGLLSWNQYNADCFLTLVR